MARRRRKSLTGRVFKEATRALPAPLQYALATPLRMFLTIGVLGAAMSYGLVSIDWQNGKPSLKIDEQRAAELKSKGIDFVQQEGGELRDRLWGDQHDGGLGDAPQPPRQQPGFGAGFFGSSPADVRAPVDTATSPRRGRVGIRRD